MRVRRVIALAALAIASSGAPLACSGGVVGGECRDGFGECNGRCIDMRSDPQNCGACGHVCAAADVCVQSACTGADASVGGSGGSDASVGGAGGAGGVDASSGGSGGTTEAGAGGANTGGALADGSAGGTEAGSGGAPDGGGNGGSGGAMDAGAGGTASGGAGNGGSGGVTDAGTGGSGGAGTGGTDGGNPCTPPFDSATNCGSCGNACSGLRPLCTLGVNGYGCTAACVTPLVPCGDQCVNLSTDESNCGGCDSVCASGICQGSQCVGATAGHEVLLCMDFRTRANPGAPDLQLLGNSVFLGPKSNVRILGYSEHSTGTEVTAVGNTLAAAAFVRGRTYTITQAATSLDVANQLNVFSYEVLLVYDQPNAPAGRLATVGTSWASAVDSFVSAGGTVVVLAGDSGTGEMGDLLSSAGMLTVTGQTSVTGSRVYNRAPADAVGLNVLNSFRAPRESCTFATPPAPDSSTVFVITDSPASSGQIGAPVVVHRVITP